MEKKIGVAIFGGTGYGAGELLRLLTQHPNVQVVSVISASSAGSPVVKAHPHLAEFYDLVFDAEVDFSRFKTFQHSVLFTPLPHGTSARTISSLLSEVQAHKTKIIDLSGDFRLRDEEKRKTFYPDAEISPEVQKQFVYGLTELYRDQIASADYVSNPGCLSSACILAAAPLASLLDGEHVHFDAKTGSSGAGKSAQAKFHHPEQHGNVDAYKILEHRHEPEIEQELCAQGAHRLSVSFVPHVMPVARGIYATAFVALGSKRTTKELLSLYREFYAQSPFVRVRDEAPHLRSVVGSNFCDVSVSARRNQVVAVAVLDNLVKGMAGQAVQNMNVMCGLPEETGLWSPSFSPV